MLVFVIISNSVYQPLNSKNVSILSYFEPCVFGDFWFKSSRPNNLQFRTFPTQTLTLFLPIFLKTSWQVAWHNYLGLWPEKRRCNLYYFRIQSCINRRWSSSMNVGHHQKHLYQRLSNYSQFQCLHHQRKVRSPISYIYIYCI